MRKIIPLLVLALSVVHAGTAFATPPNTFVGTITSRATLSESVVVDTPSITLLTRGAVDFVTATVNVAAGGSSGWHSHPGIVLVSVVLGTLTVYDASCVATVRAVGSSFVEAGNSPMLVRNETGGAAQVFVTYLAPAGTPNAGLRIDAANPGGPPSRANGGIGTCALS